MDPRTLAIIGVVVAAPLTLCVLVALVRGYTISISVHMTRNRNHD